jgi:hypothetical protein
VAKADTILAWHHKFANQTADTSAPHKMDMLRPHVRDVAAARMWSLCPTTSPLRMRHP